MSLKLSAPVTTRKDGEEIVYKCPVCGKDKLEHNQKTGAFKCWVCLFSGWMAPKARTISFGRKKHTPDEFCLVPYMDDHCWGIRQELFERGFIDSTLINRKAYISPVMFLDRLWFKWYNKEHELCGVTAYRLTGDNGPKSIRFKVKEEKGLLLLSRPRNTTLWLVEGEMDLLSLHYSHMHGAALGGKEASLDQIEMLQFLYSNRGCNFVVALDGGEFVSTLRILQTLRHYIPLEAVRVCLLPQDKDPNDLLCEDSMVSLLHTIEASEFLKNFTKYGAPEWTRGITSYYEIKRKKQQNSSPKIRRTSRRSRSKLTR